MVIFYSMRFSSDTSSSGNLIRGYGPRLILINGIAHSGSLIVMPDRVIPDWRPQRLEELCAEDFLSLHELRLEAVLLGTGERQRFPPVTTYLAFVERGIGFDVMDTRAACRTYNILASEGRRVAAALLAIEG